MNRTTKTTIGTILMLGAVAWPLAIVLLVVVLAYRLFTLIAGRR